MRITFLGHQGWQFERNGRSFLLDPILDEMGNGAQRLPIWPQRRLDFGRFEPIDAVIISHEHADHFSLATLLALPKHCRIYISDLSSYAMTSAIADLGFKVERFSALKSFVLNGIQVTPLPGLYNTLEPDTYALLMQDGSGASFLTAIDTVAHPDVSAWLAQHCPARTLDNLTNNFVESRQALVRDPTSHTKSRLAVVSNLMDFVQKFSPRRAVVSGQGWSFKEAKSHLNHSYFSVDNTWLTHAAREVAPQVAWFEGTPGMRFTLQGDEVSVDESPVIGPMQRPSRDFKPDVVLTPEPFSAWSGVRALPLERLKAVREFITERYGQVLGAHSPRLMEALYYLKCQGVDNVIPTLGISLRNGDSRWLYEFDYGHVKFDEVKSGKSKPPAVGLEIWASDLELLIGAEEEVFMVYESAIQRWSYVPTMIDDGMLIECFMWFTPRFRSREFLSFYRAQIAALRAVSGESEQ
jgi:hypothetical protein